MCRWVAYAGTEIYLEDLLFHQEHSIVQQSLAATQSSWVTNGDGFGVLGTTRKKRLDCSKIFYRRGTTATSGRWLQTFKPNCFLRMCERQLAPLFLETTVTPSSGKIGPSCTMGR